MKVQQQKTAEAPKEAEARKGIGFKPPVQFRQYSSDELNPAAGSLSEAPEKNVPSFTLQLMQNDAVIQRIGGYGKKENYYKEVDINNTSDTDVEMLGRKDKTLVKTTQNDYDTLPNSARTSKEEGYTVLQLGLNEQQSDWVINTKILQWTTAKRMSTTNNFNLPVSCIESAEHIIHHLKNSGNVPDYDPSNPGVKSVDLFFENSKTTKNEKALNISSDDVSSTDLKDYKDYDFSSGGLDVGDGLLVIDPKNQSTSLHAVVVVGKNKNNGQLIVVERNAGETTGDNMYVDKNWLVNVYSSAGAFKDSVNKNAIVGRLKA